MRSTTLGLCAALLVGCGTPSEPATPQPAVVTEPEPVAEPELSVPPDPLVGNWLLTQTISQPGDSIGDPPRWVEAEWRLSIHDDGTFTFQGPAAGPCRGSYETNEGQIQMLFEPGSPSGCMPTPDWTPYTLEGDSLRFGERDRWYQRVDSFE